jgi:hypothetical protein
MVRIQILSEANCDKIPECEDAVFLNLVDTYFTLLHHVTVDLLTPLLFVLEFPSSNIIPGCQL